MLVSAELVFVSLFLIALFVDVLFEHFHLLLHVGESELVVFLANVGKLVLVSSFIMNPLLFIKTTSSLLSQRLIDTAILLQYRILLAISILFNHMSFYLIILP